MRFFLVLFLSLFLSSVLFSQTIVSNVKLNDVYFGIANPMALSVNGYDCHELRVESTDGAIEMKDNCTFDFTPNKIGECKLLIIVESAIVDSTFVRSSFMPDDIYKIYLSGTKNDQFSPSNLTGIFVYMNGFDFDAKIMVQSFDIIFCMNDSLIELHNKGNSFSQEFKDYLKDFNSEMTAMIANIIIKSLDGNFIELKDNIYLNFENNSFFVSECGGQGIKCNTGMIYTTETKNNIEHHYLIDNKGIKKQIFEKSYNKDSLFVNYNNGDRSIFYKDANSKNKRLFCAYKNDRLYCVGEYRFNIIRHDSLMVIDPITLSVFNKAIPISEKIKTGTWTYYNKKGKAIRQEEYVEGVLQQKSKE